MIELTTIEALVMAYAPLIVTILGIVVAFLRMIKIFKEIKADNSNRNDAINQVLQENYELKAQIKELMTKIDHIKRD